MAALDVAGQTVLMRADLNVPLDDGAVADDFRIVAVLPTIQELRSRGAKVVVASHLGRPEGVDASLSMRPVAEALGALGDFQTVLAPGVAGVEVAAAIAESPQDVVVVLENTRFDPGETKNDPVLADDMATLADLFVNDAFGSAHRAHASTVGIAERLPSAAGPLMAAELAAFDRILVSPDRPYVVVMGGAKVSDKLAVVRSLLPRVDLMMIGGGMCFTMFAAGGYEVGDSLVEESMIREVGELLDGPDGAKIVLPDDIVVADRFAQDAAHRVVPGTAMPDGMIGLDIGPQAVARFGGVIAEAETVFWNGPMGVFEWESFRSGTEGIATAVASCEGYTVVGGGDSVAALRLFHKEDDVSHLSSGGGAGLEMLEGKQLPGIAVLEKWG